MTTIPLLLASGSPRRAELLRRAGLDFIIAPVRCDERWHVGETPEQYALRIAQMKATLASPTVEHQLVVAADTTVWLQEDLPPFGKPEYRAEAKLMLERLILAHMHYVTTAFVIMDKSETAGTSLVASTTTRVWLRSLHESELEAYLDRNEWQDKAGGYAIQGYAAAFIRRIEGSYTGVVGLPLPEFLDALQQFRSVGSIRSRS